MNQKEIWKDVEGFEGLYQVSNHGRVKSLDKIVNSGITINRFIPGRILNIALSHNGYSLITLSKNGKKKSFRVSRIVAIHFIDNPHNKPCVNHIDGNKKNNCYLNIEWCTEKENTNHAYSTGLHKGAWKGKFGVNHKDSISINRIDIKTGKILDTFESITQASKETGIDYSSISRVCSKSRNAKSAGGFKWEYNNEQY